MRRWCWLCIVMMVVTVGMASAQDATPAGAGEDVRQQVFEAQSALMLGDTDAAAAALDDARALYDSTLRETLAAVDSDLARDLDAAFESAADAIAQGDTVALAAARGTIWTSILRGSSAVVFDALTDGDTAVAREWFALREFRPSTRFSRPNADASLALSQLAAGQITAADALSIVRIDLYDTYQAQLNQALAAADEAGGRGFAMRRAEEAALSAGYFAILQTPYAEQRGDGGAAQDAFDALVVASAAGDDAAYAAARAEIDAALDGFRAAPLTDEEAARRAGQLVRFLALVPVEYSRGVRDGQVVKDLEIQEARTFYAGATAAFADLETLLMERDAQGTADARALLDTIGAQIDATADPALLSQTAQQADAALKALFPAEWESLNSGSDVDVILSVLDQVNTAVAGGDYAAAESARLEAYALLELGMEQRLMGFAPDLAIQIESLFWQGDGTQDGLAVLLATNAPEADVKVSVAALQTALTDAQAYLSTANSAPEAVAGNAAIIVFREGLEAVLILASLLASLRTMEERRYRRPLVMGAVLALAATGITWWVANQLLMALMQYGERLEAVVSLIAIGVLLLITNWFFHKVYWTGWMANFHARKRRLLGGVAVVAISQTIGLVLLGFSSIYREGFETVLFLQSLVLEAGIGVVLRGVALGMVGVVIVGVITFALQVRLPYKKMLVVTGIFIGVVLLTMVGNTVHVMQAVGWLPITPVAGLQIPFWMGQWFGLFATWQGIGLQIAAAAFVIGSYVLAERQTKQRRQTHAPQQMTVAVGD